MTAAGPLRGIESAVAQLAEPSDGSTSRIDRLVFESEFSVTEIVKWRPCSQIFGVSTKFLVTECPIWSDEDINAPITTEGLDA